MASIKLRRAAADDYEVEITAQSDGLIEGRINGEPLTLHLTASANSAVLRIGSRVWRVLIARRRDSILVALGPNQFEFRIPKNVRKRRGVAGAQQIEAPMPGKVLKILVVPNQPVAAGAPLVVLEAMKMETTLHAEDPAIVAKILVTPGQSVDHGSVLIELGPSPQPAAQQN